MSSTSLGPRFEVMRLGAGRRQVLAPPRDGPTDLARRQRPAGRNWRRRSPGLHLTDHLVPGHQGDHDSGDENEQRGADNDSHSHGGANIHVQWGSETKTRPRDSSSSCAPRASARRAGGSRCWTELSREADERRPQTIHRRLTARRRRVRPVDRLRGAPRPLHRWRDRRAPPRRGLDARPPLWRGASSPPGLL